MKKKQGVSVMNITYAPLWRTMKKRGVSTYALKHKLMIGGGTYTRLKTDQSVSTNTISLLCEYLDCEVGEVMCRIGNEAADYFPPMAKEK